MSEDLRPPKDDNEFDMDKETAFAKIVNSLVETDHKKIAVLTDLSPKAINGISALLTYEKFFNASQPKDYKSNLMGNFTGEFITYRISKNRKSREEIIEALKTERENDAKLKQGIKNLLPMGDM